MSMNQECLRTGDKALVHFRFIKHPEYIKPGLRLVFREGRTKAVGNVVRAIPHSSQTQSSNRSKPAKMQRYSSQQQVIQNYNLVYTYLFLNFMFNNQQQGGGETVNENGEKVENQPQKPSKSRRHRSFNPSSVAVTQKEMQKETTT